jgi:hypothetical protein
MFCSGNEAIMTHHSNAVTVSGKGESGPERKTRMGDAASEAELLAQLSVCD